MALQVVVTTLRSRCAINGHFDVATTVAIITCGAKCKDRAFRLQLHTHVCDAGLQYLPAESLCLINLNIHYTLKQYQWTTSSIKVINCNLTGPTSHIVILILYLDNNNKSNSHTATHSCVYVIFVVQCQHQHVSSVT